MKSYKIKYGGYYQKSEDKFDDNEEHLKEPLDYRPIIFNNIYSKNINIEFKKRYLDFDYYYHRDNYDILSRETVETFLNNPDAIDCALNLISFWISNLFSRSSNDKESKCTSDSYFVNKKYWENYSCLNSSNIDTFLNEYENIVKYFSDENTKFGGIGDVLLKQDNFHYFSLGPIFKENPTLMNKLAETSSLIKDNTKSLLSLDKLKSLYSDVVENPTDFVESTASKAITKVVENNKEIINFMETDFFNKPKFYYIKDEKNLKIYLKHIYFKKYFTNKDQRDYDKLYFIHNFSETISDYTNSLNKYFFNEKLSKKNENKNNFHITQTSLIKIKKKIEEIEYNIVLLNREIDNKKNQIEFLIDQENGKETNDSLDETTDIGTEDQVNEKKLEAHKKILDFKIKKKDSLIKAKKYLEDYLKKWEKNAFSNEDIIDASHILRQACYIHKIRMLIYINYNIAFSKIEGFKDTIKTQLTVSKIKQPVFTNIIKDKVYPILYGIEDFIENKTDFIR
jgi:hypothetical protein